MGGSLTFHFGVSLDAIPSNNVGKAIEVLELCIVGSRTAAMIIDDQRGGIEAAANEGTRRERSLYKRQCVGPSACETVTKGIPPHT